MADYHHPRSALLGLISAMYSLGAIVALPIVPSVVDKFGRRHSIFIGSLLTMFGGVLQGAALNRKRLMVFGIPECFILNH
jgi:MFS family permease